MFYPGVPASWREPVRRYCRFKVFYVLTGHFFHVGLMEWTKGIGGGGGGGGRGINERYVTQGGGGGGVYRLHKISLLFSSSCRG